MNHNLNYINLFHFHFPYLINQIPIKIKNKHLKFNFIKLSLILNYFLIIKFLNHLKLNYFHF